VRLQRGKARVGFVALAFVDSAAHGIMPNMPGRALERKRVERLLAQAGDRLEGDWLLVGGALALVWLDSPRATQDVDLVSLRGSQADRLALMDLAIAMGLPIEAVNAAAEHYVRRVSGWDQMLDVLLRGARATIWRPNPTLFLLLKMRRLSESDLDDCLLLLLRCKEWKVRVDSRRVRAEARELPEAADAALRRRRARLLRALRPRPKAPSSGRASGGRGRAGPGRSRSPGAGRAGRGRASPSS